MLKKRIICWMSFAVFGSVLQPVRAQDGPPGGFYQITSGNFIACCGIAGSIRHALPDASQSFIQVTINPTESLATMTFLGEDQQTVFAIVSCTGSPFRFSFDQGLIVANSVVFHRDPGPPPGQIHWNYTATNLANQLRVDGMIGLGQSECADLPSQFFHSNVVAVLVSLPTVIEGLAQEDGLLRFQFKGVPPNDYFVEYTESLPAMNWLSLTNFRAKLQPIEAVVTDSITNHPARFYRVRQQDCQCD